MLPSYLFLCVTHLQRSLNRFRVIHWLRWPFYFRVIPKYQPTSVVGNTQPFLNAIQFELESPWMDHVKRVMIQPTTPIYGSLSPSSSMAYPPCLSLHCMTVLEFICAQSPRTTQGLLIGLWYATFSIRYLVVDVLDSYITERIPWLICEGVKGFLILVSLVLFSCLSRHYRYRQRDEIVNVQGMIEDTHEKWLDQEKEYMQERRAILGNQNANNPYNVQ